MSDVNTQMVARDEIRAWTRIAWLLLVTVTGLLVLSPLVTQYNFFDGLIYASVARNMADGIGPLDTPRFSLTLFPIFTEHPPLMMWLESIGFSLFGDTIAVEKGFSALMLVASGAVLALFWRRINRDDAPMLAATPLALLLTLIAGRLAWGFANNMLENLVIPLTSLAVWLSVEGSLTPSDKVGRRLLWQVGAGLAVLLAVLTKGPVGLFPLATPGLAWIVFRHVPFRVALLETIVITATLGAALGLVLLNPEARAYAELYVSQKLGTAFTGMRGESGPYWKRVFTLLRMLFYPALATALLYAICRALKVDPMPRVGADLRRNRTRRAVFLALVGVSASLPITFSPLIFSFYFSPSLPFYAFALTFACVPMLVALSERSPVATLPWAKGAGIAGALVMLVVVGTNAGRPGREAAIMSDIEKIAAAVCGPDRACPERLAVCEPLWGDWQLHAYFERYHKIALDTHLAPESRYLLATQTCLPAPPTGFSEAPTTLGVYRLFMR